MRPFRILILVLPILAALSGPARADDSGVAPETPLTPAIVLVHGGAGTLPSQSPAAGRAARAAWEALQQGASPLDAAVAGTVVLEDDPDFNAGTGSNIRMDGKTVQMDAAVMTDRGDFGAVSVIEGVKNPILVARGVMNSPHLILAGRGATQYARSMGLPDYDPRTSGSLFRYEQLKLRMEGGALGRRWEDFDWKEHWNFPTSLPDEWIPHDTVGVVISDGLGRFAAAASTGGTTATLHGRVGDVPIPGAGLFAGPHGAVCATGWGEYIIRQNLSRRVYDWMAEGETPREAVRRGLDLFPSELGMGLIAVSPKGYAASSNTTMAWSGVVRGTPVSAQHPKSE